MVYCVICLLRLSYMRGVAECCFQFSAPCACSALRTTRILRLQYVKVASVCLVWRKFVGAHIQMRSGVCGSKLRNVGGILRGTEFGGVTMNHVGITTVTVNTLCVFPNIYSLYYSDPSAVVA